MILLLQLFPCNCLQLFLFSVPTTALNNQSTTDLVSSTLAFQFFYIESLRYTVTKLIFVRFQSYNILTPIPPTVYISHHKCPLFPFSPCPLPSCTGLPIWQVLFFFLLLGIMIYNTGAERLHVCSFTYFHAILIQGDNFQRHCHSCPFSIPAAFFPQHLRQASNSTGLCFY